MARWRIEAATLLPELWHDEDARDTPDLFLFEVLPFVREAHRRGDEDALRRGYGFTTWCLRQGGDLHNAAAVCFYEHLFDAWDVHDDVLRWIDAQAATDCWALWDGRLDAGKLDVLRARLPGRPGA